MKFIINVKGLIAEVDLLSDNQENLFSIQQSVLESTPIQDILSILKCDCKGIRLNKAVDTLEKASFKLRIDNI
jgi:hypothetical protein